MIKSISGQIFVVICLAIGVSALFDLLSLFLWKIYSSDITRPIGTKFGMKVPLGTCIAWCGDFWFVEKHGSRY